MAKLMCKLLAILLIVAFAALPAYSAEKKKDAGTFDQDSVIKDATEFFGKSTEGLAKVIEKAFKDYGRPTAYIKGEEVGGAVVAGLSYGDGMLVTKSGKSRRVYWSGPSVGFDYGANAAKVFVLVSKTRITSSNFSMRTLLMRSTSTRPRVPKSALTASGSTLLKTIGSSRTVCGSSRERK